MKQQNYFTANNKQCTVSHPMISNLNIVNLIKLNVKITLKTSKILLNAHQQPTIFKTTEI